MSPYSENKAADNMNCPGDPDWHMRNNHCYLWGPSLSATWEKALDICRAYRNTELVYLDSVTEKDWLSARASGTYWTGLNDRATESVFQWTTNNSLRATLVPFLKTDLVNGDPKDCVQLDSTTGLLTDSICSSVKHFICKSKQFMDWFRKEEDTGLKQRPPFPYQSKPTLAEAKIACLQQGTACAAVLETYGTNAFYILHSSATFIFSPQSTIYTPSVCASGFPGPKCGFEDQICDCTGIVKTSFAEVCGVSVEACKQYCAKNKRGVDCSMCIPVCPDDAAEVLKKDEASVIMLAKRRLFGGATILTVDDYLDGFKLFYKKN
ncbi:C-type mannose receptor 2-like isoform X2 [Scyliorhinus canicula]|uniref:C-type mannose receptor 2-like isoform X2 n=1 Tax=Scyliorhinus canicula TaxID=7830 RepID=UPI0018F5B8D4|nr:C-type mannose receptor 2-like isoform X2 [Scyliorhinus canicula]